MKLFIRKVFFLVGLTLCVIFNLHSQVVTSTGNGLWTDPGTWAGGQVPTSANASGIVINHDVIIPEASVVSMHNTIVHGTLTIESQATVTLQPDALTQNFDLQVFGTLLLLDSSSLNGTSIANTSFESGSHYIHRQGPLGFIPYATWNITSTFEIAGFRANGYINIAHSDSWRQVFGNVVYNCPQQTTPFVDLNGNLRNIAGSLTVINTNNKPLRLSTNQNSVISIGGDFIVEGPSEVWFSMNATNAAVNIGGSFIYRSTSGGISYLSTKGRIAVSVAGDMEMNSVGRIHMASVNTDSIGPRQVNVSLSKDLLVTAGLLVAPPPSGKGTIIFKGVEVQRVLSSTTGSTFQGNLDFVVQNGSTVSLGNSVLSSQTGTLLVQGTLQVGSSHPQGAIQTGNNGNLYIQNRIYEPGSTVEYNGTSAQWIGTGHPATPGVNLTCSNAQGVTLLNDVVTEDLRLSGDLMAQNFIVTVRGDITIPTPVTFDPQRINLTGSKNQNINAPGITVRALVVNKTANGRVTLGNTLAVGESLLIESSNTSFYSNGYLTLVSLTDQGTGTSSVGPLPSGSSIIGDVTVQRYMSGEGRIYRYISSPVGNASVASLMDDFPVTGTFLDPSTGPGLSPANPSFYFYDESRGSLQAGWLPYPSAGLAHSNPLQVGKGYAAFIRNGSTATTWDVTGTLNQGTIPLPVTFTPNNAPSNGWNLVGNPYACAIQWDEDGIDSWTRVNISAVIAIRDNGTNGGTFKYWDMDEDYSGIPGGQIASGQSFWVRATAADPALTIREGAKAMGGATFFRTSRKRIPSFALHLSNKVATDVAYFKIRPTANAFLDHWDGLKLDNDNFDLSFISKDDHSLAVYAQNEMVCDDIVKIGVKDLSPGLYTIGLTTKHQFANFDYTVIDSFSGVRHTLGPGDSHEFRVTSESASSAFDRFSLRVKDRRPSTDILASGPATACSQQVVIITLMGVQEGVVYSTWNDQGRLLAMDTATDKTALKIRFPADSLSTGLQVVSFKAHSACYTVSLPVSVRMVKDTAPHVVATDTLACSGTPAVLIAISDRTDAVFSWFSAMDSRDTLSKSSVWETPPLKKTTRYYVAAAVPSGCSSVRFPVNAEVVIYDSAKISRAGDILSSNYTNQNRWYLNGQTLEDDLSPHLTITQPGVYTLETDTLGCISRDSIHHFITRAQLPTKAPSFYPNPVKKYLFIHNADTLTHLTIFNSQGAVILQQDSEQLKAQSSAGLDVSALSSGVYEAILTDRAGETVVRFLKE